MSEMKSQVFADAMENFNPLPVPDTTKEQIKVIREILRLADCMASDYNENNYGDAQRWIRHITDKMNDFPDIKDNKENFYAHEFMDVVGDKLKRIGVEEFAQQIKLRNSNAYDEAMRYAEGVVMRNKPQTDFAENKPVAWLNDAALSRGVVDGEAGEEDNGPGYIPVYREPNGDLVVAGWQFFDETTGQWFNGDDRIRDHRKNTEEAGYRIRNVYVMQEIDPEQLERELAEKRAVQIYNSWGENRMVGWVPWVVNGNSEMQELAREFARDPQNMKNFSYTVYL